MERSQPTRKNPLVAVGFGIGVLLFMIILLIWVGPRIQDGGEAEASEVVEEVDPFADVPREAPPPPRKRKDNPFEGLSRPSDLDSWQIAVENADKGESLRAAAYEELEQVGAEKARQRGYEVRLWFLKALESTEPLVSELERRADDPDAETMLRNRERWQKRVDEVDRDFGLVARGG